MVKLYWILFLIGNSTNIFAQSIESIKQQILSNQLMDAKSEVENFLALPENKNNADAWYFKGYIYNLLSKDTQYAIPLTNAKAIAFNAFVQCLNLQPNHKWLLKDNYRPLMDIYYGFFENGRKAFANELYEEALDHFINAEKTGLYLHQKNICYKNIVFPLLDTSLVFNIATTAIRAKKEKEGIFYFIKIAEAKLKDPIYIPIYHALIDYFVSINDEIGFRKYLRLGRSLYPYDNFWVEAELDMVKAGSLTDALIKESTEKIKKNPSNFNLHYTFCTDLLQVLFYAETKPRNYDQIKTKLEEHLEKCLQLQKKGVMAEFLCAQYYQKTAKVLLEAKPGEKEMEEAGKVMDKSIQYAGTVFKEYEQQQNFSRSQLETYKLSVKILIDGFTFKKQDTEVLQYQEKLKHIETILPVFQGKK